MTDIRALAGGAPVEYIGNPLRTVGVPVVAPALFRNAAIARVA
jgi:hypothetical protein